jgi:hypothetical protein
MSRAFQRAAEEKRRRRGEVGRVGETQRRVTQTAHLRARLSLSLSLTLSLDTCNPYYEHPGAR